MDNTELVFDLYYGGTKIADTTHTFTLTADKKGYRIQSHAAAVGLAKLLYGDVRSESSGIVSNNSLVMTLYTEKRDKKAARQAIRLPGSDSILLE